VTILTTEQSNSYQKVHI